MQPIDRWKRDLDQATTRRNSPASEARAIRELFAATFRHLPRDLLDALLEGLDEGLGSNRERTVARCATVGSILLMDYDGGVLMEDDWDSIREAFSDAGGEVDLDLLAYTMQLVLDKGRM